MKVTTLDEAPIRDIGQAFGYYDYGEEHGLIDAFPSRDAAAAFICGYVRMALQGGMLHTTSPRGEGDRLGVPVILETDAKNKFRCSVGVMLMLHRAFLRKNNI